MSNPPSKQEAKLLTAKQKLLVVGFRKKFKPVPWQNAFEKDGQMIIERPENLEAFLVKELSAAYQRGVKAGRKEKKDYLSKSSIEITQWPNVTVQNVTQKGKD